LELPGQGLGLDAVKGRELADLRRGSFIAGQPGRRVAAIMRFFAVCSVEMNSKTLVS